MTPSAVVFPRDSWQGSPCLDGALPVASAEGGEALAGSSTLIRAMDELPYGSKQVTWLLRTVGGRVAPEGGQGVLGCRVSALQRAFKAQQVGKRDITQGLVSLGR